jgi:ribosomal protein L37E
MRAGVVSQRQSRESSISHGFGGGASCGLGPGQVGTAWERHGRVMLGRRGGVCDMIGLTPSETIRRHRWKQTAGRQKATDSHGPTP